MIHQDGNHLYSSTERGQKIIWMHSYTDLSAYHQMNRSLCCVNWSDQRVQYGAVVLYWAQAGLPLRWRLYQWAKCDQAQAYTIHAHSPSLPFYSTLCCASYTFLFCLLYLPTILNFFVNVWLITAAFCSFSFSQALSYLRSWCLAA